MNKILVITDNKQDQVNGVVVTYKNLKEQARADGYSIDFIDPSFFKGLVGRHIQKLKLVLHLTLKSILKKLIPTTFISPQKDLSESQEKSTVTIID